MSKEIQELSDILERLELSFQDRKDLEYYIAHYRKTDSNYENVLVKISTLENYITEQINLIIGLLNNTNNNVIAIDADLEHKISILNITLENYKKEINTSLSKLGIDSINSEINTIKNKIQELEQNDININNKINTVEASFKKSLTDLQTALNDEHTSITKDINFLKNSLSELGQSVETNVDSLKEDIDYIKENLNQSDGVYTSSIEDKELQVPSPVGGIASGTKLNELENKTFSQLFDDILFPTVYPTFTDPSASISRKNYNSIVKLGSNGPTINNFTTSFSKGSITLNGVKQNDRAGDLDTEQSYIFVSSGLDDLSGSALTELGNISYKYRAYYGEGPQPKDNKGNDYGSPLQGSYKDSSAVSINVTLPWFASTSADGVVEQSLISWSTTAGNMSTGNFVLQPSGTTPQVFKIPRKLNSIQKLNTISGKMEDESKSLYTETTETITINNTKQTYYVYTYNGSDRSDVTLSIKF